PAHFNLTEVHQVRVEQCAVVSPAIREDVAEKFPKKNVAESVIFTRVEEECEKVRMPDFMTLNGQRAENVWLPHRKLEHFKIGIGDCSRQASFDIRLVSHPSPAQPRKNASSIMSRPYQKG